MKRFIAALTSLLLALSLAACGTNSGVSEAGPAPESAEPASETPEPPEESDASQPAPTPEATPEASASETPEETAAPEESEIPAADIDELCRTMLPLLRARALTALNGETAFSESAFWDAAVFALDACGLWFDSAEAVGETLEIPGDALEEIGSGLFSDFSAVPEIPEGSGISYRAEDDVYILPFLGTDRTLTLDTAEALPDGGLLVTAELTPNAADEYLFRFTFELAPNPREENTVFFYTVVQVESERETLAAVG